MHSGPPHRQGPPYHQGAPHHHQGVPHHRQGLPPYGPRPEQDEAASFAPTILVNAACIGLVIVALLMFLLMARLLLATSGTTGGLLAVGHGILGLAAMAGAAGVRSGRLAVAIVGLVTCPLAGVSSLFALLTGSVAGLAGGALALVTLVVVAISLGDVARMGAARRALRVEGAMAMEPGPPSGPLSADLPRVKPRRWPVLVALAAVIVLGGIGAAATLRFTARAEREKEHAAFRSLEECLLGGKPGAGVPPSLAYRRMELQLVVAPPSTTSWPARCATHAHALHESKRRSGAANEDVRDTAFLAERLGKVLTDPRGASVYAAVDELWAEAAKEGYEPSNAEAGTPAPPLLDADALARVAPFSKSRLPLASLRTDRVSSPAPHILVDGARQRREGRLCTLDGSTFRCAALPPPLDEASLTLLGGAEAGAAPLLFAGGGQAGIFRATGELVAETPSYGGIARADGSIAVVGYDQRASELVLLRAGKGATPKRTPFALEGVSADRPVALLDDVLVWAPNAGEISVARLLPSGAPLGASAQLTQGALGDVDSFEACRSREAFFVLVNGSSGSALAVDTGDRWSPLVPVGDGTLGCSGKEAFLLQQRVRAGGTGSISLERCTTAGCQKHTVDLDEVFQQNVELLPKLAPLALPLDGKLLLVWRAGQRAGLRMRLAPIEHIAAAEDVVLFDDRVQDGHVSDRSNLLEMRGWSWEGRAVVFLSTTSGVWALAIDGDGKVTPIDTTR